MRNGVVIRLAFSAGLYAFFILFVLFFYSWRIKTQDSIQVSLQDSFVSSISIAHKVNPAHHEPQKAVDIDAKTTPERKNIQDLLNLDDTVVAEGASQSKVTASAVLPEESKNLADLISNSDPIADTESADSAVDAVVVEVSYHDSNLGNMQPKYPIISRKLNEEGEVLLVVMVSADGRAVDIKLEKSSGFARLDNSALYAVSQWRFIPATNARGQGVSSTIRIPFEFKLDRAR